MKHPTLFLHSRPVTLAGVGPMGTWLTDWATGQTHLVWGNVRGCVQSQPHDYEADCDQCDFRKPTIYRLEATDGQT
jgi:hypothetical protein